MGQGLVPSPLLGQHEVNLEPRGSARLEDSPGGGGGLCLVYHPCGSNEYVERPGLVLAGCWAVASKAS